MATIRIDIDPAIDNDCRDRCRERSRRDGVVMSRHRPILVVAALGLTGCIHTQAYQAATLLNRYDFVENRYEEACLPYSTKPFCSTAKARLDRFRKHAQELAEAIKNGGSAKLQLDLAASDAKGLKDVR